MTAFDLSTNTQQNDRLLSQPIGDLSQTRLQINDFNRPSFVMAIIQRRQMAVATSQQVGQAAAVPVRNAAARAETDIGNNNAFVSRRG